MKEILKSLCDSTINNYRKMTEEFRFDGEYVNQFASLFYSNIGQDCNLQAMKEIRKYFIKNTSRMCYFRGDVLYILSFLISIESDRATFIEKTIDIYERLKKEGFKESSYSTLASYIIVKYSKEEEQTNIIKKMYSLYMSMKKEYPDITGEEDYIACAILAIENISEKELLEGMENILCYFEEKDMFSKNSVQGLIMAFLTNTNNISLSKINELLVEFERRDMKVSHQFLPFIGATVGKGNAKEYVNKVEEVSQYLCDEEFEYEFYMDRSFREFMATAIIEFSRKSKAKYINELIAICVCSFSNSKNQGIFSEILA